MEEDEKIVRLRSEWLPKLCPHGNRDGYVEEDNINVKSDTGSLVDEERKYTCYLYTDNYRYRLSAVERVKDDGYLSCIMSTRKPRAGENWTRGSDLPDGPFTEETWDQIVSAILANELVPLSEDRTPRPDVEVSESR